MHSENCFKSRMLASRQNKEVIQRLNPLNLAQKAEEAVELLPQSEVPRPSWPRLCAWLETTSTGWQTGTLLASVR